MTSHGLDSSFDCPEGCIIIYTSPYREFSIKQIPCANCDPHYLLYTVEPSLSCGVVGLLLCGYYEGL